MRFLAVLAGVLLIATTATHAQTATPPPDAVVFSRDRGWFYLSTILDDFSRYIIAWKVCTMMKAEDVTYTLKLALAASGIDAAHVIHRPRLLSDNGSSYLSADPAKWL